MGDDMQSETCEEPMSVRSPDLIDLDSPTNIFHTPGASQRPDSPGSDAPIALRREYNGFLKATTVLTNQTQDIFQKINMGRNSSNQSNLSCETVRMRDYHNEPLTLPTEEKQELNEGTQKLVSFVGENSKYSDRFFASPENFKDKRETDVESSDLSFGCPSLEKFRMTEDHSFIQSSIIDQDLERVEGLLEGWTTDLKKKILAEFSQSKIRLLEYYRQQIAAEKEKHNKEMSHLRKENDSYRGLVKNFEESLRVKDDRISELNVAIGSYKNKMKLQKYFSDWKIKQNEAEKERIMTSLALRHYRRSLMRNVCKTWYISAVNSSRSKREKACQVEAEEFVIEGLRKNYEERLASMKELLEQSRKEIERLNKLRESSEASTKRATRDAYSSDGMRTFRDKGERFVKSDGAKDIYANFVDATLFRHASHHDLQTLLPSHQEEPTYFSDPNPPVKKVASPRKKPTSLHFPINVKVNKPKQVKIIPAKRSNAIVSNLLGSSLAPPMASVVVERHHPINKETIGQAFASKFPVEVISSRPNNSLKRRSGQLIRVLN